MGGILTQTPTELPSSQRAEPGSFQLKIATLPDVKAPVGPTDVNIVASQWVELFNKVVSTSDLAKIPDLFLPEAYWRDHLCLTWDFHTLGGPEKVTELLSQSNSGSRIKSLALDKSSELRSPTASATDAEGNVITIQAFLTVETDVGRGSGLVRLMPEQGKWKVFTLFTFLTELRGFEEALGKNRPLGVAHGEHISRKNWLDQRNEELNFEDGEEPTVLILGAGQSGLTTAARLKMLGVKTLMVDREERIGDNWRTRYHQLVLHDPVWLDHLPYFPFPAHWPIFTPKDKIGSWFEIYAQALELNAWTQATITNSSWDDSSKQWTVTVDRIRDGKTETRVLHPKHIIQATGASGESNFPSDIKGISSFTGNLTHSSKHPGAKPSQGQNKRAIVVGCCNSGHDIAQDFYENGYSVTMVQRSTTHIVGANTFCEKSLAPIFAEGGPPTEDADIILHSVPNPILKRFNIDGTKAMAQYEEKLRTGLTKAGFKLDDGPDGSGIWIKYLQRGGGYYLDVGASQLIVDGKIKIKQGQEITEILPNGIKFADGEVLEADEIIFATGYLNMRTQCRKIFGDEVADRVKDVWGFDEEGEIRTIWRKTGHPGFWFMGGNLALCRFFSRLLALQIKGLVEGLYRYEDL